MTTIVVFAAALVAGAFLWTLGEYLLHRFAMHELYGKGIMSREHLNHHVHSTWRYETTTLLSWIGVWLTGGLLWAPLGWWLAGPAFGVGLGLGWIVGYFHYEYQHAVAHRRAPSGRYSAWLRVHHFHHHFGHPMTNHGVTLDWWDRVFGTLEQPEVVRVPRRLAMPWLLDDDGELRPEFRDRYVLVGATDLDERQAMLDRARAFASLAPTD
ncbi:MAG: sterol desaturase family protein [Acidimicrobiales bacterium]|nr:sterol desaturase family protein [Acidimicrobiales bacterium]